MTDETSDSYEADLAAVWPAVRRAFNYPLVRRARFSDETEATGDAYRWHDDEVVLSKPFLDRLDVADEADRRTVLETLLKHEVGHYVLFPRELVHHLRYLQRASETFGDEYGNRYYSLYADVCVDLRLIGGGYVGEELFDLRERTLKAATTASSDVEETVQRRIHRLLLGIYQETFDDVPCPVSLTDVEQSRLDSFLDIDYFADEPTAHERNVVRFGNALERVLADVPGREVRELDSPLDDGKPASSRPFGGDDPATIPEAALDEALSDAVDDGGSYHYERLLDFLESRADFDDPMEQASRDSLGAAGIEPGTFEHHDEVIPFYRRWARNFPLYVADTSVPVDDASQYRRGRRSFQIDDPLRNVNPFASFGILGVPSITKVDTYTGGTHQTVRRTVPDLLVGIDSSASMPHPASESYAILAAFLLAATYRRNGARVGGYNFSAEVAFLPPTRDLSVFYSLACGYWGGGTVFDHESLADFVTNLDDLDGVTFSSTDAYARLLETIEANDIVPGKKPTPFDGQRVIDHVLITDGDLVNRASLVEAIHRAPASTRTFVFITDDAASERWVEADIDAWIYRVPTPDALADCVLGLASQRLSIE